MVNLVVRVESFRQIIVGGLYWTVWGYWLWVRALFWLAHTSGASGMQTVEFSLRRIVHILPLKMFHKKHMQQYVVNFKEMWWKGSPLQCDIQCFQTKLVSGIFINSLCENNTIFMKVQWFFYLKKSKHPNGNNLMMQRSQIFMSERVQTFAGKCIQNLTASENENCSKMAAVIDLKWQLSWTFCLHSLKHQYGFVRQ